MTYWRCHYHIVFATKYLEALITPEIEIELARLILAQASALGVHVHAIGCLADHMHLAVDIPPSLSLASVDRRIKSASARHANELYCGFAWQAEYSVHTVNTKGLASVINYVQDQKDRHASGEVLPELERLDADRRLKTPHL